MSRAVKKCLRCGIVEGATLDPSIGGTKVKFVIFGDDQNPQITYSFVAGDPPICWVCYKEGQRLLFGAMEKQGEGAFGERVARKIRKQEDESLAKLGPLFEGDGTNFMYAVLLEHPRVERAIKALAQIVAKDWEADLVHRIGAMLEAVTRMKGVGDGTSGGDEAKEEGGIKEASGNEEKEREGTLGVGPSERPDSSVASGGKGGEEGRSEADLAERADRGEGDNADSSGDRFVSDGVGGSGSGGGSQRGGGAGRARKAGSSR